MLQALLAGGLQGCDFLDAAPAERTAAAKRAWKRASEHLADMDLAEWTMGCNLKQHCALTTAQLRTHRRACQARYDCEVRPDDHDPKAKRRFSRSIRRWRRFWGFRISKLRLRDHFAEGELQQKAPLRNNVVNKTRSGAPIVARIWVSVFGPQSVAVLSYCVVASTQPKNGPQFDPAEIDFW